MDEIPSQENALSALMITQGHPGYTAMGSADAGGGTMTAWKSRQGTDALWDEYLAGVPGAHFYQTSMWAEVRKLDGWQPQIVLITRDGAVTGGFQVLTRSKPYIGKIGLVLKGPVVNSNDAAILNFAIRTLKNFASSNQARALIVQPPDRDRDMPEILLESGFSPSHLEHTIKNNTVVLDLRRDEESLFMSLKKKKRQNIRSAMRSGMIVREGGKEDLGIFFSFMLETCKRQHVEPSPSSLEFLNKLWDLFSPTGNIRLFVSEYRDEIVSCLIVLPFGDTAYLWKFGWSGEHPRLFPNEIIYWEIFKWARVNGYSCADMGIVGRDFANAVWNGDALADEDLKTYSRFKLSLGGEVLRLTEGFVYFSNPVLKRAFDCFMPLLVANPYLKNKILFSE